MIIDKVKLSLKAGDGGNGAVSFHREKYVAEGGPDGGDGGNGGNIILRVESGDNTLLRYKYRHKFVADNGDNGLGRKFHGATAADMILPVPPGTIVRDAESNLIIRDMADAGDFLICRGGKGGWGNRHFATPTRQVPRFAKNGRRGEMREVVLELKMLADVGLIGFPNVGKSSILSIISAAKPKIADYHFTTLSPNLGVVQASSDSSDGRGFVAADIPGLIEGASDGAGLGHEFLRHVERCRLLLHVVDISGSECRNPIEDIETINAELAKFSRELSERPQIIVANKIDAMSDGTNKKSLLKYAKKAGTEVVFVSAATGEGITEMVRAAAERLSALPPIKIYESELDTSAPTQGGVFSYDVDIRRENGMYIVEAEWLYNIMLGVNFSDRESLMYFQRVLRDKGVNASLESAGVVDGDTVAIYDFEFDFVK